MLGTQLMKSLNKSDKKLKLFSPENNSWSFAELQRIVNMDRRPNIFVFENLMNTEYRIIRFLKLD